MRSDTGLPDTVQAQSRRVTTRVQSWRDGRLLAGAIPLDAGTLDMTGNAQVPGRLDLSFPSTWAPRTAADALAVYGQRLYLSQTITGPAGRSWTVPLGWWLVQAWDHQPPSVAVEALSLEQLIADARFTAPYRRGGGDTFASTLRRLCEGILPVDTSAMTDRPIGASLTADWEEDRLAAVRALAAAWPARLTVDDDAVLTATDIPDPAAAAVHEWRHGTAGAYVSIGGGGLRDELYNAVVARGELPDGTPVQHLAFDNESTSPTYYLGPFGRRPRFYASPLITSADTARTTAQSLLRRELTRTATVTVTAPPDPRIQLDDPVAVVDDTGRRFAGVVTELSLPLTVDDGEATYLIGIGG